MALAARTGGGLEATLADLLNSRFWPYPEPIEANWRATGSPAASSKRLGPSTDGQSVGSASFVGWSGFGASRDVRCEGRVGYYERGAYGEPLAQWRDAHRARDDDVCISIAVLSRMAVIGAVLLVVSLGLKRVVRKDVASHHRRRRPPYRYEAEYRKPWAMPRYSLKTEPSKPQRRPYSPGELRVDLLKRSSGSSLRIRRSMKRKSSPHLRSHGQKAFSTLVVQPADGGRDPSLITAISSGRSAFICAAA